MECAPSIRASRTPLNYNRPHHKFREICPHKTPFREPLRIITYQQKLDRQNEILGKTSSPMFSDFHLDSFKISGPFCEPV